MLRRFEIAETPVRFWEIDYRTRLVLFRWGTVGRLVQSGKRGFSTQIEATRHAEQQIAAQVAKGYVEIGKPVPAAPDAEAREDAPPADKKLTIERTVRFERRSKNNRDQLYLEVIQEGRTILRQEGRVSDEGDAADPDGRTARTHRTVTMASTAFDEALADAEYDGWKPLEPLKPIAAPAIHENPALEAQCLESPDSPEPWSIYADWLMTQHDVRGEIASLHLAGKVAEANKLIAANFAKLCTYNPECFALQLRHGFVRGATIKQDTDEEFDDPNRTKLDAITRGLLESPLGRFVDSLRFGLAGYSDSNDWAPTLRAIIESEQAPRIRELRFDAYRYDDCEISWATFGDFTGLLAQLPALELVHIRSGAGGTLGVLDLPRLRTFVRESGGLAAAEIASIVNARWPRLEHLEIWFGSRNYGAESSLGAIRRILDAEALPNLVHLGIVNCEFVEDAIDGLASSKLLPQLHSLDLSKGVMSRRGARAFAAHAPAFRHLASIDLGENLLSPDEVAQIRGVLDNVIVGKQRESDEDYDDEDDPDAPNYRYVAVGE